MVMMHGGMILFEGTPQQLKQTDDPIVRRFLMGQASAEELAAIREGAAAVAISARNGENLAAAESDRP
jgi:ABC-type transporter Mla maintaining outer membrane lipid asymmetry ATPase subunit MlaF